MVAKLERAEETDLGNSHAWSWSNPMLDVLYNEKAQEVRAVMLRVEAGENVPREQIDHALDNSALRGLGGYP